MMQGFLISILASIPIWNSSSISAPGVSLTPFLPESSSQTAAAIVCPGGSYFWLGKQTEGYDVAQWLADNGIAAFVLKYRTGGWFDFFFHSRPALGGHKYPEMVEDVQRAIQIVREGAESFNIDPNRIGTMGFSAGGHLAMLAETLHETDFLKDSGVDSDVSLRPDFIACIYPVVSFTDKRYLHRRSLRGLLGEKGWRNPALRDSLSIERHIKSDCPPVFVLNCKDDPVVDWHNGCLLDSALTAEGVRHKYINYEQGGHGFGANAAKFTSETSKWQSAFLEWMNKIF